MYPPDSNQHKPKLAEAPWIVSAVLSAGMLVVMAIAGKPLQTDATPFGILHLEFAYRATEVQYVISSWSKLGVIPDAIQHTWLDFFFLLGYAPFLAWTSAWLAARQKGTWQVVGQYLHYAAWTAGLLDILENAGLLYHLQFSPLNEVAFFTALVSVVKWVFALSALLYVIIGGLGQIARVGKGLN